MAARTRTATKGKKATAAGPESMLRDLLVAHAPADDVAAYEDASLEKSTEIAFAALKKHRRGESVIRVDADPGIDRQGLPVTVITVVNDNMPFLFDSILGEINEWTGEPLLVLHPVLVVSRKGKALADILGEPGGAGDERDGDKVSVVQVHVARLSPEDCRKLEERLAYILAQVHAAVRDWKPMLARLDQAITDLRYVPVPLDEEDVAEAIEFLEWLRDENFTFLGMREFRYRGGEKDGTLQRSDKPGLGILTDPEVRVLRRGDEQVTATPEIRAFLHGPEPMIITKANAKSVVHRRIYLDYIGVKTFDKKGRLTGELRIVGLFTSTAYTRSVMKIPYLRSKAKAVIARMGFAPTDHSGKALINLLESYPRDELFQIGLPMLRKHADAILALGERPRVRVVYRVDQFDRFVSVIVFVPRDRYDSDARQKIGDYLKTVFKGRLSAYYPAFPEGMLARVHFIIGRSEGKTPKIDPARLEADIREIVRTWDDALREALSQAGADTATFAMASTFPQSYRDSFAAATALVDARRIATLSQDNPIAVDFHRHEDQNHHQAALKIYHHGSPVALSQRVPLLENMGFRVISERTFELSDAEGKPVFLHDMEIESAFDEPIGLNDDGALFEEMFLSVWTGRSDSDRLNALAHRASLRTDEIGILRAYSRYLQQAGIPQSQGFIATVLNRYPATSRKLYELFTLRFEPKAALDDETRARTDALVKSIETDLEGVPNLDDDTIIRRFLNLVQSTLRTNRYSPTAEGEPRSLALKFDSRSLTGLPQPRPWREIFVYGPEVEGVHLRFGPIARGGIRWSDRAQDYRTEVLGLVKAQQVKNAVIVPVGAKGGFFPRRLPAASAGREAFFEAGKAAYVNFITSLLSVTDNLEGAKVVPPKDVVRHDVDDPYFVVAADKGTATFSDTANAISQAHGFWLDDAFASGGSAGYDHKKMGITARGAWEAVKRHFREMDRDIQVEPFTAVGVGDMSGDVFGNGMLRSPETRLIAAFDHRDIFIDPDPDPKRSLAERQRLYDLPRSSWQDYDKAKLSKGGMIVSRAQKTVSLSPEAAAAIGFAATNGTPAEIMSAILKAPVDLLWFGGIGTYVRGPAESNEEVGDRNNDAIRVTATELRVRVVGEGANLGMTQKARIAYGLAGGRCNSDAIDNSAGVNCSDVEVNIKIALAGALRAKSLTRPARDKLLSEMTENVAELVLTNNYEQTLAISMVQRRGLAELPHQARMMTILEGRGLLDRAVEFLPGPQALAERESRGEPLTRAEIGVLLAYAKIVLFDEIVASTIPDEPHFEDDLIGYFPPQMQKKYGKEIRGHRLRREIIATHLANHVIDRGGPSFVTRLQDISGRPAHDIVAAFSVVRDGFALPALFRDIDALDNKLPGSVQMDLYQRVWHLIDAATAWFLKNGQNDAAVSGRIARLAEARNALEEAMPALLPTFTRDRMAEDAGLLEGEGVPAALATRIAALGTVELIPDIALVASVSGAGLLKAGQAFFAVTDAFRIARIEEAARSISPTDYYDGMALTRANDMIGEARRAIAVAALGAYGKESDPVAAWIAAGGERIVRVRDRLQSLTESGDLTVSRLTVAAGLMSDLTALRDV